MLKIFSSVFPRKMAGKKFIVGEFSDNTVEVFPQSWVAPCGKLVWWPYEMTHRKVEKAIITCSEPKENWKKCTMLRVLAQSDSYQRARNKAKLAEFTSGISDTEPECVGRRQSKRPDRYRSSESDSDPMPPKRRAGVITSTHHQQLAHKSGAPLPDFPESDIEEMPFKATPVKRRTEEIATSHHHQIASSYKTPSLPDFPEIVESGDAIDFPKAKVEGKRKEMNELMRELLKEVHSLKYEVRGLKAEIKKSMCKCSRERVTEPQAVHFALPLDNDVAVTELCSRLREEATQNMLIQELTLVGGASEAQMAKNIMRRLLTNKLCKEFSCCGKMGKKNLSALPLYNAIEKALRTKYPSIMDTTIRHMVGRYLTGASDREGGRKERMSKKPQI